MKKMIAIIVAAGLLGAMTAVPDAYAGRPYYGGHGHRHGGGGLWAAGLIGGIIGLTICSALSTPSYAYPAPPPRYYAPEPERVWVPGHYENRLERRWIPGHWEGDGFYEGRFWVPGQYRDVEVRVWIPGHWEG